MRKEERIIAARIAAEVRRTRTTLGWSQLALAERAGLSLNYVSLIERAEQLPSVRVLVQLAEALGMKLGALVGETPADTAAEDQDPWLVEMTGLLRTLPLDARPVARAVLRGVAEATPASRFTGAGVRLRQRAGARLK
jgi:transcriptional regulator with XRE-family HTH domain